MQTKNNKPSLPPLKTADDLGNFAFSEIAKTISVKHNAEDEIPDIIEWILSNKIKTEKGERKPFEFDNHFFMVKPLRDWSPRQVVRKGSQIGFSTCITLKEFYAAKYRDWNSIHTFPTLKMAKEFVPTKVDGLLDVSPYLKGEVGRGAADSIQKKKFGGRWIFWAGCEGENEGIMTTADIIANDEVDKSDPMTVRDFMSRTKASDYGACWNFSNPTGDGAIVTRQWKESNQQVLVHKCSRCNKTFVNNFYECIDEKRKIYICRVCHQPLREEDRHYNPDTKFPQWVARWRDREISGYWINHMIAPWIPAKDTIEDYQSGDEEYFHKFVIAKAIVDPEAKITREVILRNCTASNPDRTLIMAGIDQGKSGGGGTHYMVIGNNEGIFGLETVHSWTELDEHMRSYNVNSCVVDYLPDTEEAVKFEARWPGKVLFNYQIKEHKSTDTFRFDELKKFVYTDRHRMIGTVVKAFLAGGIKVYMNPNDIKLVGTGQKDYKSYCAQAETLYRDEEKTKDGDWKLVWRSINNKDHWFLATCYYYAAKERFALETEEHAVEETTPFAADLESDFPDLMDMESSEEWLYV